MHEVDQRDRWLVRDYTGQPLSELEAAWLRSLRELLEDINPGQVDPQETIRTHEGEGCLICVLPHRGLGGLSIVATLQGGMVQVSWAQVGTLAYHDDFDLAHEVARVEIGEPVDESLKEAAAVIREQLGRAILLRVWSRAGACFLAEADRLQHVATIGSRVARLLTRLVPPRSEHVVRFTDPVPPPLVEASQAKQWVRERNANA